MTQFPVVHLEVGELVTVNATLGNVLTEYISCMEQLLRYSYRQFTLGTTDPAISFVLTNADTVFNGLNASTQLRFDSRAVAKDSLQFQSNLVRFASISCIV